MAQSEYIRPYSAPSRSYFLSIPYDSGSAVLTFLHAGRSSWPRDDAGPAVSTERGHSHSVYHAVLYTSGHNIMIHEGGKHPCRRGTLVLTDPGCVHEYRPQTAGGASFIEITFNLRCGNVSVTPPWKHLLSYWLGINEVKASWPVNIPPPDLERLEGLMNAIVSSLNDDTGLSEAASALAMGEFILNLGDYFTRDGISDAPAKLDGIEKAKRYLEKNFSDSVSISDLARIACLSEGAFIRSFSTRFGFSPMVYRKRLRITAAKHLLAVSGRSIGEIASNVGYGDIYVFSRTFKTEVGKTASQWRKDKNKEDS